MSSLTNSDGPIPLFSDGFYAYLVVVPGLKFCFALYLAKANFSVHLRVKHCIIPFSQTAGFVTNRAVRLMLSLVITHCLSQKLCKNTDFKNLFKNLFFSKTISFIKVLCTVMEHEPVLARFQSRDHWKRQFCKNRAKIVVFGSLIVSLL